jgi:hypothetical protein
VDGEEDALSRAVAGIDRVMPHRAQQSIRVRDINVEPIAPLDF